LREDASVGGGNKSFSLRESGFADAVEVEQGGELLGELLDEVDFTVEMEDFASQGAAFALAGGEVAEQQGDGSGCRVGSNDVADGFVFENDRNAAVSEEKFLCDGAEEGLVLKVKDAESVRCERGAQSRECGEAGRAWAGNGFEAKRRHRSSSVGDGEAEDGASLGDEGVGIERLSHVEVCADLLAPLPVELLTFRGEQDDVNVAESELVLNGITNIEAVELGHHDVEEHEVRFLFADGRQGIFAVACGEQLDAFVFEIFEGLLDQSAEMWFIVNNENFHKIHW
jgi:hypothetical protein